MPASQTKLNRIADWLILLAMPGILAFIFIAAYDIYLLRTNPASPDATHVIEQISHGSHRFFTPRQAQICSHPFIGLMEAFPLLITASFLQNGCKFNKFTFSKRNP